MKPIVLSLALLVLPIATQAQTQCTTIAEMGRATAMVRDSGKTLSELQTVINQSEVDGQLKAIALRIAESVYYDAQFRRMTPREVALWVYDTCLEASR